jgi:hypothetical protein
MTISGFSYVRNGIEIGYPFLEAVQSILPVCDEFIIAVGDSTDGTREAIEKLNVSKIKIVDTAWDMNLREGGKIFAQQANIALDHTIGDWAFHIQADEVIHERDLPKITDAIHRYNKDERVEGFILPFYHFWGDYTHIRTARSVHLHEIRIFRNNKVVRSYKDSQGFRKYSGKQAYEEGTEKGEKLSVKKIDAPIYHYNGVRPKEVMKKKLYTFSSYYDKDIEADTFNQFNFQQVDRVAKFKGTHPKVMEQKVNAQDWEFEFDPTKSAWRTKDKLIQPLEDLIGFKIGEYKNYKLLR